MNSGAILLDLAIVAAVVGLAVVARATRRRTISGRAGTSAAAGGAFGAAGIGDNSELRAWWPHPPFGGIAGAVRRAAARRQEASHRRLPSHCDERLLRDLGIDRAAAESDSVSTFWRLR